MASLGRRGELSQRHVGATQESGTEAEAREFASVRGSSEANTGVGRILRAETRVATPRAVPRTVFSREGSPLERAPPVLSFPSFFKKLFLLSRFSPPTQPRDHTLVRLSSSPPPLPRPAAVSVCIDGSRRSAHTHEADRRLPLAAESASLTDEGTARV